MKKLILIMLLFLSTNVFAGGNFVGIITPETKTEKIVWTIGSSILILSGLHTMEKGRDDLTINILGAGALALGTCGLYYTLYRW